MTYFRQALLGATATDIQDIADILGVTFQEHCAATPLKVGNIRKLTIKNIPISRYFLPKPPTTQILTRLSNRKGFIKDVLSCY